MASMMNTVRVSGRAATKYASSFVSRRAMTATARKQAATNFTMPALSPTMTEGNIAQWRIKEGESFNAGDVLLEIETDKATMDVEAADSGILMKITAPDSSKQVQVGTRIAVLAEPDDDISKLELPADESAPQKKQEQENETRQTSKLTEASEGSESSQAATKPESKPQTESSSQQSGKGQKQKYPLYPSVEHLFHLNGIPAEKASEIPASGPGGRLLKGDVLAYLGKIDKSYPAEASARLTKLSHLDLSNIQIATPPPKLTEERQKAEEVKETKEEVPQDTELAVPISLTAVIEAQRRIEKLLETSVPLSVFIARASELANEGLPLSKKREATADELFNAVLGLPVPARTSSRGHFSPQIETLDLGAARSARQAKKSDIFDVLTSSSPEPRQRRATSATAVPGANLFSVTAKAGEEKRAQIYLERVKNVLENDPGRLVL